MVNKHNMVQKLGRYMVPKYVIIFIPPRFHKDLYCTYFQILKTTYLSQFYVQKNTGLQVGKSNKKLSPKKILLTSFRNKSCILDVLFQKIKEDFTKMCFESTVICVVDFGQIAVSQQIYENFFPLYGCCGRNPTLNRTDSVKLIVWNIK